MSERTNTAKWVESRQRWQINVQRDGERKTFTSTKRGRTGQREANAKADAWVASEGVSSSTKVSDLYVKFLEMKKETTSATNYCPMEGRWRLWIEPVIGQKRINKLTSGDMQDAIDHALSKGRSKKFLQNMRTDMSAFLKWCRRHRYCTLNCEDIEVPKAARSGERHILQPRDIVILFNTDTTLYRGTRTEEEYINAYRLAVLTGMRPGELVGLRWEDLQGNQINLKRSVNIYGETTNGKNENAQRPVYLSDLARQVLDDQQQLTGPAGSVFCIKNQQTLYKHWQRFCQSNGIQPCSLYELRHTFVSMADSLPEGQLRKIVGHSQSMDTYGIYAHTIDGEGEEISSNLDAIFEQVLRIKK